MPASRRRKPFCWRPRIANAPSAGEQAGREQRDPEQQVEPERGADDLGDVAGRRHDLGLDPEPDRGSPGEGVPAGLGEVLAGRDPELGRLGLDHHRDQVRSEHDPEQQVAELGAAGDVGGEVARVDVGDGGDEGRAEERPDATEALGRGRRASAGPPARRPPRPGGRPRPRPVRCRSSAAGELAGNRLRRGRRRPPDRPRSRSCSLIPPARRAPSCSRPARRPSGWVRPPTSIDHRARRMARGS